MAGPSALLTGGTAMLLALTGCAAAPPSPNGGTPGRSSAQPAGTVSAGSSGSAADYGVQARRLATRVPGCAPHPVSAQAVTRLGLPDAAKLIGHAVSAAICTLQGRTALLVTYRSRPNESSAASAAYAITAYFGAGPGWLAVPVDLSEPVGQQSIVQDLALALGGQILSGAKAPRATAGG